MRRAVASVLVTLSLFAGAAPASAAEWNVVKVSIDGIRWIVRGTWGVVKVVQRLPEDTVDTAFKGACRVIGCDPNAPLWGVREGDVND